MNISFLQSASILRLIALTGLFSVLSFQVRSQDTIPPVVNCVNGLSINQFTGSNCSITIWASDFLAEATDNITSSNMLKFAVRISGTGTGTGFPMINGVPQINITFTPYNLGINLIELWAMDEAGNSSFCETYILIQDNMGTCDPLYITTPLSGKIRTELDEGVEDVSIEVSYFSPSIPNIPPVTFTNQLGYFNINNSLPIPVFNEIKPKLDADPLNGVNTWDLVLISRHILNLQPLNTPYKLIAADANKSGTVTTFDIVELRKLLLGTYQKLPNNTSWRFVDKTQVFTDNDNPFANIIRESLPFYYIIADTTYDFVGIKIGDVDNTAISNNLLAPDDRNAPFTAFHITRNDANHWLINKGETVELTFSNPTTLSGYQLTLETDGIQPSEVVPGEGMSIDHFGLFDHAVTTVFEQGNTPFSIRFTAEESGDLRDMVHVSSRITPAMAFGENGEKMQVNLRFEGEKSSISPNPWSEHTRISFHTSEATTATLKVFDMAGRLVYFTANNVEKGEQAFELNAAQVPITGVLFYEITTKEHSITGKTIKNEITHH